MSGNRRWILPALAGLVALTGCGREPSVASRSAAAFEEARKQGKTFAGAGHGHGDHGHGGHETPDAAPAAGGEHRHGAAQEDDHSAMGHGGGEHAGHAPDPGAGQHAGHGSPAGTRPSAAGHDHAGHGSPAGARPPAAGHDHAGHARPAAPRDEHAGHSRPAAGGHDHAGHSQPAAPTQDHGAHQPAAPGQDHAGHSGGGTPTPTAPELPAQPAGILKPDPLDAPAATSVLDAQRSAELAREMSGGHGGHGGHGSGSYRQIDAGRGPGAYEGSEPQTPGAGPQHHDHGGHAPAPEEKKQAALYACPMHPEVTSKAPGTCPKCGMALVERREE